MNPTVVASKNLNTMHCSECGYFLSVENVRDYEGPPVTLPNGMAAVEADLTCAQHGVLANGAILGT